MFVSKENQKSTGSLGSDLREYSGKIPGLWYVAHTRSRNEKILVQELTRWDIYNYLPLVQRVTRSAGKGRIYRSLVPLFPGYVFLKGIEEQRVRALTTNRIVNLLNVPNQGQLVDELAQIQRLLSNPRDLLVVPRLREGDWGRIMFGPLKGLEGVVLRQASGLRLVMNVTILNQGVSVEVDHDTVEPIDSAIVVIL